MNNLCVLGSLDSPEFRNAQRWMQNLGGCEIFATLDELLAARSDSSPSLIVIAQSMRGQFPESIVADITASFPNARLLTMVGSWCEGETRSGSPLPDIERIYAAEFATRLNQELPRSCETESPSPNAIVISHNDCFAESVAEVIASSGGHAIAIRAKSKVRVSRVNVVVYDAHPNLDCRTRDIERIRHQWECPIIALIDFPRAFEIEAMEKSGVASVLPKPFAIENLVFLIETSIELVESSAELASDSFVTAKRESAA